MASQATYWQRGETLDYINETDEEIAANGIVVIGSRIGVAGTVIPAGALGTVHVEGCYFMPKASGEEIAIGTPVYYDESAGTVSASDPTESSDDDESTGTGSSSILAGYAAAPAAEDAETVLVKINA